jgi:hypothetical protein
MNWTKFDRANNDTWPKFYGDGSGQVCGVCLVAYELAGQRSVCYADWIVPQGVFRKFVIDPMQDYGAEIYGEIWWTKSNRLAAKASVGMEIPLAVASGAFK